MSSTRDAATAGFLTDLDLPLPNRRSGKVRISWDLPGERKLFVTTDRLSAFDRLVAPVPLKGQVLNQLAWWWFERTRDIVANHALSVPDPNALVATAATPLRVEVIVRGYITGVTSTSLWRRYEQGERTIYGHTLPDGLRKNERLPRPLVTPTTKAADGGHDEPLSCGEVVSRGLVGPALWEQVQDAALRLFARGEKVAWDAGLILADTKYEFGLDAGGNLLLIDEVHTPDSSRYWEGSTFVDRYMSGQEPVSLDKEIVRRALVETGWSGEGDVPVLDPGVWEETSRRYVAAYETLTGEEFVPGAQPVAERLMANLSGLWGR
ncbi:MAG: phosphoribosylaminoimidazolesuccinocarboxamide synthase [Ilumatobacteraceae bacterium]